jgi:hypothetical protein
MEKEATLKRMGFKTKTPYEKRGNSRRQGSKQKPQMQKRQPQNARGSNEIPPMKKEATLKDKVIKMKTSDEKRGNPKPQGAQNKDV